MFFEHTVCESKVVSQRWGDGLGADIDFSCKGGGDWCTFILFLRSTGCDVGGLNTDVGAKNLGGVSSLSTVAPPHFNYCSQFTKAANDVVLYSDVDH